MAKPLQKNIPHNYFNIVFVVVFFLSGLDVFQQTPSNPVVGDIVTVVCNGEGSSLRWFINGRQVSNQMTGIYNISTIVDDTTLSMWISTLVTTATLARNGTRIKCSLTGGSSVDPKNSTTILIAGGCPETLLSYLFFNSACLAYIK